jgi:hypothetical protein
MAYYTPQKQVVYNNCILKPCSVIVNYTEDGRIKPMYIKYITNSGETLSLKVDSAQPYKDSPCVISIICLVIYGNRKIPVTIIYNKADKKWSIIR